MIDQETKRKMRLIGIPEAVDVIDMMDKDPSYANMSFDDRIRLIVDHVAQEKENGSIKRLMQRAHFRIPQADISAIDYDNRSLDRATIANLSTCQFALNYTDVIIVGYTGTGKTYLSNSLGRQACKHCLSTLYVRMPDLLMGARGKPRCGDLRDQDNQEVCPIRRAHYRRMAYRPFNP